MGPPPDGFTPQIGEHDADHADVRSAQRGDPAAMGRIYQRHARMVRAVLLAYVGPDEADDLVQEVFVRALGGIAGLREQASIGAWLAGCARNEARGWKRAIRRRWSLLLSLGRESDRHGEHPAAGAQELDADDVLAAIRRLPEEYREVLILRLVEQLTGPQIAAWSGRSHAAVRVCLSRGMRILKQELGLKDPAPSPRSEPEGRS